MTKEKKPTKSQEIKKPLPAARKKAAGGAPAPTAKNKASVLPVKRIATSAAKTTPKPTPKPAPPINKSARYPDGRVLDTDDKFLTRKKVTPKKRWVTVVDSNSNDELAVVKLTTQDTKNTTPLEDYSKGNKKKTYFKHFVENKDNDGKPIVVDNVKFTPLEGCDLTPKQVSQVKDKVFNNCKQAQRNRQKRDELRK